MSELLVVFALAATFGAVVLVATAMTQESAKKRAVKVLEGQVGTVTVNNLRHQQLSLSFGERAVRPFLEGMGRLARKAAPAGMHKKIAKRLALAGSPEGWDVQKVMALKVVGTMSGILLALMIVSGDTFPAGIAILLGILALISGYLMPDVFLMSKGRKRQTAMRKALPDTMDLLTIVVEAGLGFDAALARVMTQVPGPLSEEFGRMLREMRLGSSRSDAFRHLGDRTDVPELRSFVVAMIQAEVFGVSTTKVLRAQAAELRKKRRQTAEEKAQKLGVKLIIPLVFCIMPALMVVAIGPSLIAIMEGTVFG